MGSGDKFMMGEARPERVPKKVVNDLTKQFNEAFTTVGPVEMEWVYDGFSVWIVQLHKQKDSVTSEKNIIYPGNPKSFVKFKTSLGLEKLRELISGTDPTSKGIILVGDVGITSHFGDLLRNSKIPSKIDRKA